MSPERVYRVTVGGRHFDMRADLKAPGGPVEVRSVDMLCSQDWSTMPFTTSATKGGMWIAAALCLQWMRGDKGKAVKVETMNAIVAIEHDVGPAGEQAAARSRKPTPT